MKLLVSVRSCKEAEAALLGGADLIDIKEPAHGPLGRASDETISAIVAIVAGRAPVSAAMGELNDPTITESHSSPDFIKFGLAGCRNLDWRNKLQQWRAATSALVVPVGYADHHLAEAPSVEEIVQFAIEKRFPAFLIDTFDKTSGALFDWLSEYQLGAIAARLRQAGVAFAVAGSCRIHHLPLLQSIEPAWLAVRGAVCREFDRNAEVDRVLVHSLKLKLMKFASRTDSVDSASD